MVLVPENEQEYSFKLIHHQREDRWAIRQLAFGRFPAFHSA
jgi:hypothetical protein